MAVSAQRYEALKRQIEQSRKDAERAEGALAQIEKDVKSEFGVKNLDAARLLRDKLEKQNKADERELEELIGKLENKYELD